MNVWNDIETIKPKNRTIVLIACLNDYGKNYITLAEYVSHKSTKSEDFLSEDCESGDGDWYDEEEDCYWVNEGFFEFQYASDINYRVSDKVLFWMDKPMLPICLLKSPNTSEEGKLINNKTDTLT